MQIHHERHGNMSVWTWLIVSILVFCLTAALSSPVDIDNNGVTRMLNDVHQLKTLLALRHKKKPDLARNHDLYSNDKDSNDKDSSKEASNEKDSSKEEASEEHNSETSPCDKKKKNCINGHSCKKDTDCMSGVCYQKTCKGPTCNDGIKNSYETDVDCSGTCPKCINGKACNIASDCVSGVCTSNICQAPTCSDGIQNQDETDVNCGGGSCPKCIDLKVCNTASDCVSGVCTSNICQAPTCTDGIQNQDETDVNCGGGSCPKCIDSKVCNTASDCVSGVCTSNICQAPTCSDGIQNQDETDVNCGGGSCPKCIDSKVCNTASDCVSGVCTSNICQAPTCSDGVRNQDEADADCGGRICGRCTNGKGCAVANDCISAQCSSQVCQSCSLNSFKNGDFESGDPNGWIIGGGLRTAVASSQIMPKDYLPGGSRYNSTIAKLHSQIVKSNKDPILLALMPNIVHQGQYAFRVEDSVKGGYVSVISQQINNYFCLDIYFAWLAVLENGNHTANESSVMIVELADTTENVTLLSRHYDAGAGSGGVDSRFRQKNQYFYTPSWENEHLTIENNRIGHNFTLTVLAADCKPNGHKGYVYIDSFGGVAPLPNGMK